jgi:hypothetical protein
MPGPAGRVVRGDLPGEGVKRYGILGVDAALDGVAAQADVLLPEAQLLAGGDADLLLHQVDAGDHLGHGVLDLDARVHLDEEELAPLVQELERAGAAVADPPARLDAALADLVAQLRRQIGRRRLLHDLLVAALQRAVALAEVHGVLVRVGEHLDLDVARLLEIALEVHHGIGERGLRFGARHVDRIEQRGLGVDDAHAAAAAAPGRLDDHRVADLARDLDDSLGSSGSAPSEPGTVGTPALAIACLALTLSPIRRMFSGRGPMKTKPERSTFLGEVGVFRQETVAGMDRLASVTSAALMIAGMLR